MFKIDNIYKKMLNGGRLIYIGAGTSGRLGIQDASECPPTFGVSDNLVIGLIAGGDKAIRKSQEFAEDNLKQGWLDLLKYKINNKDSVIGIAASGTTPYVIGAIENCRKKGILTISTTVMIKLGIVKGNKMVDMQLANNKLIDRAEKILMKELDIDLEKAQSLLRKNKSVRKSLESKNQR